MDLDHKVQPDSSYIMNLNAIKQEAPGTDDNPLKLLEEDVFTIKSVCKLEYPSSNTFEPVESDENILVKQELLHEELDIKSEDDQGNQPCKLKKVFKCNICGYSTSHKSHFKFHLKTHSGEKPFKCNICDTNFRRKDHLYRHLRTHSGEKPFKCNICDRNFSQKSSLKKHLRIHTGEKYFNCNICDFNLSDKTALYNHLRTHTGEKPFQCNVCNKRCSQKINLKTHMITHSRKKSR